MQKIDAAEVYSAEGSEIRERETGPAKSNILPYAISGHLDASTLVCFILTVTARLRDYGTRVYMMREIIIIIITHKMRTKCRSEGSRTCNK